MAADINHVFLIGRLTRDAELKYTTAGLAIASFAIALNRRKKNGDQWTDEVSFFDITLFGKTAETLKQWLVKGKQVAIEGELRQDRWEQDGKNRSKVVITANNVQLLGSSSQGSYSSDAPQTQGERYQAKEPQQSSQGGYADESFEDDIPF